MPSIKNPFSMSNVLEQIQDVADKAKSNIHDAQTMAEEKMYNIRYVDLTIQFIGASGLPKMDVVGTADPYFIAKIDKKISFVSTVKPGTLAPVWNEIWKVKNVPEHATLSVEVLDKDDGTPTDDYIGKFTTSVSSGAKEAEIEGPLLHRARGTFWLKIDHSPSTNPKDHPYQFDGPIRYSRHSSPTVGALTNLNDARLYSTWKMYIRGISLHFGDKVQPWNHNYKAAQSIFQGPSSAFVRSGIQAGHRMLYARSTANNFGIVEGPEDILALLRGGEARKNSCGPDSTGEVHFSGGSFGHRIKPAVYTYIISAEDDSFRFSETGAAFFVDFASKHALHSNCAEAVRYSGEFHPRPVGGWEKFSDDVQDNTVDWELIIDNNSGTYSPDAKMLPTLQALFEYNFPGFMIKAMSHEDPELGKSTAACRAYALSHRGIKQEELQPHIGDGEVTLSHEASHWLSCKRSGSKDSSSHTATAKNE